MSGLYGAVWRLGNLLALCSLCFLLSRSGVNPWIVAVVADLIVALWLLSALRDGLRERQSDDGR